MCSKQIGLQAQVILIDSTLNGPHNLGDLYDHFMSTRFFTLIMNKRFIGTPKTMRQMATGMIWIANYLALIACFIS